MIYTLAIIVIEEKMETFGQPRGGGNRKSLVTLVVEPWTNDCNIRLYETAKIVVLIKYDKLSRRTIYRTP